MNLQDFQFISNIGGAIGLWMGFSLMTTFEYIEFLIDIITLTWRKRKQHNSESHKSPSNSNNIELHHRGSNYAVNDYSREVTQEDIKLDTKSIGSSIRASVSPKQVSTEVVSPDSMSSISDTGKVSASSITHQTGIGSMVEECVTPIAGE